MRTQAFPNREARKAKRSPKGKRVAGYKLMIDADGRCVERDDSEFCCWLYCHGETRGGAWIVSIDATPATIFFLPQRLADRLASAGGVIRWGELIPIHEFSMPRYLAIQKQLAA